MGAPVRRRARAVRDGRDVPQPRRRASRVALPATQEERRRARGRGECLVAPTPGRLVDRSRVRTRVGVLRTRRDRLPVVVRAAAGDRHHVLRGIALLHLRRLPAVLGGRERRAWSTPPARRPPASARLVGAAPDRLGRVADPARRDRVLQLQLLSGDEARARRSRRIGASGRPTRSVRSASWSRASSPSPRCAGDGCACGADHRRGASSR
jgi:hypothetical protein